MSTDYTRPSTWRKFHKEDCEGCHADCCRLPVEVKIHEFIKMGLAFEDETPSEIVKRLKKERIIRLFDNSTQIATLFTFSDGSCLFLDKNRRCTVYENRPKTCRDFPKIGPRPGLCPKNYPKK